MGSGGWTSGKGLSGCERLGVVLTDVPWPLRGEGAGKAARVTQAGAYRRFWTDVGGRFPDLGEAASTRYYADNERRLFTEHFPALKGLSIFKTDLWDEARNTRILAWASRRGAHVYGIDISEPTVVQARAAFECKPNCLPIDILQGQPLQDVEIVVTDLGGWVTGTVRYGNGLAVVDDLVVAFPVDRSLWRPFSRQIRSARTDWAGQYRIGPLPPGQYLLVAVDDFEETETDERETLDQISPTAVPVALGAGEMRVQDLRADAPFSVVR